MSLVVSMAATLMLLSGCTESGEVSRSATVGAAAPGGLNLKCRLGERYLGSRRYGLALKAFQEALAGAEDSVRAYVGTSRTYLALKELTLAGDALGRATGLDSGRAEVAYARAELFLVQFLETHQGPVLERALAAARQAARLAPDQWTYFYGLGNLYTHSGDLDSAEAAYHQALALDPHLAVAYERLGSLYKYQGRFAEAEKAYRRQLELQPENARSLTEIAVLYRAGGRLSEARELLEEATRLDTGLAAAYLNLGQLYLAEGRAEAGKSALKRFRELNRTDNTATLLAEAEARPRNAEAHLRLANAYVADGDYRRAEKLYLKSMHLDSSLVAAHTGLSRLYLLQRRLEEEAENMLQQGRAREPSAAAVHTALGESTSYRTGPTKQY